MRGGSLPTTPRAALAVALALASAIGLVPALAPAPAAAAGPGLSIVGETTYDVLPDEGRVAVTTQLTATNHLKDTPARHYSYRAGYVSVVPGASNYQISGDSPSASVSVSSATDTYTNLEIDFGAALAAGRSTTLRLTFDLPDPGGPPDRAVRISKVLVSFAAWAVATPSTPGAAVTVRLPEGYTVTVSGGPLAGPVSDATGHETWSSGSLEAPLEFVADVSAERPAEYVETSVAVQMAGGPVTVAVRAWPDDKPWQDRIGALIVRALPILEREIGLPWPLAGPLAVREALVRTTGGYVGVFDPATRSIDIAYAAADGAVLHELAHAWFNGALVRDRWAAEGFAAYYAELTAQALGIDPAVPGPLAAPTAEPSNAAMPLNAWGPPGSEEPATEAWAYTASLQLARQIAGLAGPVALRAVWSKASRGIDAYQSGPAPDEPVGAPDWRGLLDLLEVESGQDFTALWRARVVRPADLAALADRVAARAAYRQSAELARAWRLPVALRLAMRAWQFDVARRHLPATDAVLRQRDELEAAANAAHVTLPRTMRRIFEWVGGLAAAAEAEVERTTVDAIRAAGDARPTVTSIVDRVSVEVGLLSTDPEIRLGDARTALAAGDLEAAYEAATAARSAWSSAVRLGQSRIVSVALLLLALLLVAGIVRQRRRARLPGAH